jgi:hypothetical protein
MFYSWGDILTTHIEVISYHNDERDSQIFLLVGLISGDLESWDISHLNFKKEMIRSLNIQLLGHYIELFKNEGAQEDLLNASSDKS